MAYVGTVRQEELRHIVLLNVALEVVCCRSPSPRGDVPGIDAQELSNNRRSSRLQVQDARRSGIRVVQDQLVSSDPVRDCCACWCQSIFVVS